MNSAHFVHLYSLDIVHPEMFGGISGVKTDMRRRNFSIFKVSPRTKGRCLDIHHGCTKQHINYFRMVSIRNSFLQAFGPAYQMNNETHVILASYTRNMNRPHSVTIISKLQCF